HGPAAGKGTVLRGAPRSTQRSRKLGSLLPAILERKIQITGYIFRSNSTTKKEKTMNDIKTDAQTVFTHVHIGDAPRELVYQAFSTAEALNAWWGPANCDNSLISLDFRPGGIFHYRMVAGDTVNYGRFVFNRIDPPAFLDFTVSFADANANAIDAPFDI